MPFLFWTGVSTAYWTTILTPVLVLQQSQTQSSEIEKLQKALFGMCVFGIGECCGYFYGLAVDKLGNRKAIFLNLTIIVVNAGVTVYSINGLEYNYLSFIMTFLWGLQDASGTVLINTILSSFFDGGGDSFGIFNLMLGFSTFVMDIAQG